MLIIFFLAVIFCVYTYAGFPIILHLRARASSRQNDSEKVTVQTATDSSGTSSDKPLPTVSVLIAAHNEADRLPNKLASLRALDYPTERLQICIVSDGSSDNTVEWLKSQSDITWDHYEPAAGKPTALNRAVELATGEFLVFTDARQLISANAVQALISRFDDDQIGAVSGELVLSDDGVNEAANIGLYWRYEKWIRMNEAKIFSTTGATGALYAIRRTDASRLPADTLLDDFETPIGLLKQGRRTVFEPAAKAFDAAESEAEKEFLRKSRTLAGNFQSFSRNLWLFSPAKNRVWWQFLSHKVARLLVPYAMLIAFIASALGQGVFLSLMFWAQVALYVFGFAAIAFPQYAQSKYINIIKVFLTLNAAAVVGAYNYFTGQSSIRWKKSSI